MKNNINSDIFDSDNMCGNSVTAVYLTAVTLFSILRGPVRICKTKDLGLLNVNDTTKKYLKLFGRDVSGENILKDLSKRLTNIPRNKQLVNRNDANIGFADEGGLAYRYSEGDFDTKKYLSEDQKRVIEFCNSVVGDARLAENYKIIISKSSEKNRKDNQDSLSRKLSQSETVYDNYDRIGRAILYLIINDSSIADNEKFYIGSTLSAFTKHSLRSFITNGSEISINFYGLLFTALMYIDRIGNDNQNRGYETIKRWREGIGSEDEKQSDLWYCDIPDIYKSSAIVFSLKEICEDDIKADEKFRKYSEAVSKECESRISVCNKYISFKDILVCNEIEYSEEANVEGEDEKAGDRREFLKCLEPRVFGRQMVKKSLMDSEVYSKGFDELCQALAKAVDIIEGKSSFSIFEGEEGVGKSMLMKAILYSSARSHADSFVSPEGGYSDGRVCVLVPLDEFANDNISLEEYIYRQVSHIDGNIIFDEIKLLLSEGRMRILFDNLDDVNYGLRDIISEQIVTFALRYPCTYICAVRNGIQLQSQINRLAFRIGSDMAPKRYKISPFDEGHIRAYAGRVGLSTDETDAFIRSTNGGDYKELISNPQQLSLVMTLYMENQKLAENRSQLCRALFDMMYGKAAMPGMTGVGYRLWSNLGKLELKQLIGEFAARCFYDGRSAVSEKEMNMCFRQILRDRGIDEDISNLIYDYSENLGLFKRNSFDQYVFRYSLFRDYFAAIYYLSENCRRSWDVSELLDKKNDGRNLARCMYEIDPDYCKRLVANKLKRSSGKWGISSNESEKCGISSGDSEKCDINNDIADRWTGFKEYLKSSYDKYMCYPDNYSYYWEMEDNIIRTPLMELMHIVTKKCLGNDIGDDRNVDIATNGSRINYRIDYNEELCNSLRHLVSAYDNNEGPKCLRLSGELPEAIERIVPEWYAIYDDDGQLLEEEGPLVTVWEWTATDGYDFTICINDDGAADISELDRGYPELRDILMNERIFKPYADYLKLGELANTLAKEGLMDGSPKRKFGLK